MGRRTQYGRAMATAGGRAAQDPIRDQAEGNAQGMGRRVGGQGGHHICRHDAAARHQPPQARGQAQQDRQDQHLQQPQQAHASSADGARAGRGG